MKMGLRNTANAYGYTLLRAFCFRGNPVIYVQFAMSLKTDPWKDNSAGIRPQPNFRPK
jgi:hypothetical protein